MQKVYNRYQWIAVFCVTLFILSGAFLLLVSNKRINKEYVAKQQLTEYGISGFEAGLVYEQLQTSFSKYSKKTYDISGYTLSEKETKVLNGFKKLYRRAVVICMLSFAAALILQLKITRRRLFSPLILGPAFAALTTACISFYLLMSKAEFPVAFRRMLFKSDYSYFGGGLISGILPPEYAGKMMLYYILYVALLCGIMLFGRFCIYYWSRPHKF